jgi:hypothetical protein
MHWHRITTGASKALTEDYYRRFECNDTGLLQALRMNGHRLSLLQELRINWQKLTTGARNEILGFNLRQLFNTKHIMLSGRNLRVKI